MRSAVFWVWRRVAQSPHDISEEDIASIFRVEEQPSKKPEESEESWVKCARKIWTDIGRAKLERICERANGTVNTVCNETEKMGAIQTWTGLY
jgi:hypothetical protein